MKGLRRPNRRLRVFIGGNLAASDTQPMRGSVRTSNERAKLTEKEMKPKVRPCRGTQTGGDLAVLNHIKPADQGMCICC